MSLLLNLNKAAGRLLAGALMFSLYSGAAYGDEKGRAIMEKNDALPEADDSRSQSVMVIYREGQKPEMKEFESVSKKFGDETRTRSTFTKPSKIQFLNWSQKGEDSQQWIRLSSGSVRKIASGDRDAPFVGSHFYYEDVGSRHIDDYEYKYLGEEKIGETACYKIEMVKVSGSKVYEKAILYLRKADYVVIQADLYEPQGHTKTMRAEKIEKINGIYTPKKVTMDRTDGKGKTIIYVKAIEYNGGVSSSLFSPDSL